ncbi:hypothetical protein SpCBS45565_g06810 [Spizellomyces sp. 'palustris']|nr:hypothetical protein SpCBS45565_g06810 [Spizellomyces sp. 'palustris']
MPRPIPPKPSVTVPPFNDITRHNLSTSQLAIRHILDRAHHIALDTEFTGLGNNRKTKDSNIELRYRALADVARTHAIVSFGISVFEAKTSQNSADTKEHGYIVHNFNFLMLRSTEFRVNSESMTFLVDNAFDFNRLYRDGIFYKPGADEDIDVSPEDTNQIMRLIFAHILSLKVPIVVHNGLLDLLFIYYSFHADLPNDLGTFVADMLEMFPAGIYDTKYVADYVTREKASFLAYLFRKYERVQLARSISKETDFITCEIKDRMPTITRKWIPPRAPTKGKRAFPDTGKPFCEQYAAHGICNSGRYCTKSHDLDIILDDELGASSDGNSSKRRRKRQKQDDGPGFPEAEDLGRVEDGVDNEAVAKVNRDEEKSSVEAPVSNPAISTLHTPMPTELHPPPPSDGTLFEKYHSACFDAYMTGFIFAHQLLEHGGGEQGAAELRNKIYLMSKPMPLLIQESKFSKTSEGHRAKMEKIAKARANGG